MVRAYVLIQTQVGQTARVAKEVSGLMEWVRRSP